jgi:exopolysaccharide biosynthesis polyprenyl glycosylphosphotransferase
MKRSELIFGLLRIPLDFGAVLLGFFLGYELRLKGDFIPWQHFNLDPQQLLPLEEYFEFSLMFAALLLAVFAFFRNYNFKSSSNLLMELRDLISPSIIWVLSIMAYFFVIHETFFSRLVLGFSVLISFILFALVRLLLNQLKLALLRANIGRRRVLLIGANKISQQLAKALLKNPNFEPVGFLTKTSTKIPGLKKLGTINDLEKIFRKFQVEEVIQTDKSLTELQDHEILEFCQFNHLDYRFVPEILEVERSNIEIHTFAGFPLIHLKPTPLDGWGKVTKRIMDIIISAIALVIFSPVFALIALLIKLDSRGPILFSKLDDGSPAMRIGQYGKPFRFYKFRTMKHKSHNQRYQKANQRKGPLVKIKNDSRITRFGKFLRRFDLDELPQFWNVLTGKMSLVGPRPHLPEEVANYERHHNFLLTIKPGISGLSQTSGRSDLDFEDEVSLDSTYIKHWSPFLDFKILLKTLIVALLPHNNV